MFRGAIGRQGQVSHAGRGTLLYRVVYLRPPAWRPKCTILRCMASSRSGHWGGWCSWGGSSLPLSCPFSNWTTSTESADSTPRTSMKSGSLEKRCRLHRGSTSLRMRPVDFSSVKQELARRGRSTARCFGSRRGITIRYLTESANVSTSGMTTQKICGVRPPHRFAKRQTTPFVTEPGTQSSSTSTTGRSVLPRVSTERFCMTMASNSDAISSSGGTPAFCKPLISVSAKTPHLPATGWSFSPR